MNDPMIVDGLLGVMHHPERFADEHTTEIVQRVCEMDEQELDRLLCAFHQAASADGFDAADIGSFWHVMGLPLPYIVIRTNNRA